MVAGERRRPAASSTAETVMDLLPIAQRTGPLPYQCSRMPRNGITLEIPRSLRPGEAEAGGSSARHPALVQGERGGSAARALAPSTIASVGLLMHPGAAILLTASVADVGAERDVPAAPGTVLAHGCNTSRESTAV